MDIKELKSLITYANTVIKSGASEITLEVDNVKVTIKADIIEEKSTISKPIVSNTKVEEDSYVKEEIAKIDSIDKEVTETANLNYIEIKSPMIGTFYRKPGPEKETFVNVGDEIQEGMVVCVIEAMKLFNEIESEISGKVIKVLVEDGTPVEYDQPLFLIDPS